ncbi:MAG: hypothetical protein K6D94_07530 [Clostridiales bacterium]|nr:hypothetical protein [Clostridiales bacterium]
MGAFRDKVRSLISQNNVGTVKKGDELEAFLSSLDGACGSAESYDAFADILPERYI